MKQIKGGVTAPKGFRASGEAAGIKPGSTKRDCALIVSDAPAAVAGTFTANVVKAAPVHWCKDVCDRGSARAIFANSGNANACTGEQGNSDVLATAKAVAGALGLSYKEVCVCSTGVIGLPMPMDRLKKGVTACARSLAEDGGGTAAEAIMTTDTVPKEMAKALVRDGEGATKLVEIRVSGAGSDADALAVARSVATSQLCKTAFFGQDPNWGRFACAAGYAGVEFDPARLAIRLDDVQVFVDGMPAPYEEEDAATVMRKPEFVVALDLGGGPGSAAFWTSDLSHDYVTINADYRS